MLKVSSKHYKFLREGQRYKRRQKTRKKRKKKLLKYTKRALFPGSGMCMWHNHRGRNFKLSINFSFQPQVSSSWSLSEILGEFESLQCIAVLVFGQWTTCLLVIVRFRAPNFTDCYFKSMSRWAGTLSPQRSMSCWN